MSGKASGRKDSDSTVVTGEDEMEKEKSKKMLIAATSMIDESMLSRIVAEQVKKAVEEALGSITRILSKQKHVASTHVEDSTPQDADEDDEQSEGDSEKGQKDCRAMESSCKATGDGMSILEKEEQTIKRVQVYERALQRLPFLSSDNWTQWAVELKRLAARLRVVDKEAFYEAAMLYRADASISAIVEKYSGIIFDDAKLELILRECYLTPALQQFAVTEMSKLVQGQQEALSSYLTRFELLSFLHPARDSINGQAELRAALIGGLSGTTRQIMGRKTLDGSLSEVHQYLMKIEDDSIWNGFKTLPPIVLPKTPSQFQHFGKQPHRTVAHSHAQTAKGTLNQQAIKTCYSCGWPGHKAVICDMRARKPGPGLSMEKRKGFWERKRALEDGRKQSTTSTATLPTQVKPSVTSASSDKGKKKMAVISSNTGESELCTVDIVVEGVKVDALVDTGASVNVIQRKWLVQHVKDAKIEMKRQWLQPIIGNKVEYVKWFH